MSYLSTYSSIHRKHVYTPVKMHQSKLSRGPCTLVQTKGLVYVKDCLARFAPCCVIIRELKRSEKKPKTNATHKLQRVRGRLLGRLDDLRYWWQERSSGSRFLPTRIEALAVENSSMSLPHMLGSSPPALLQCFDLEAAAGWYLYHAHVLLALRWTDRIFAREISVIVLVQAILWSSFVASPGSS